MVPTLTCKEGALAGPSVWLTRWGPGVFLDVAVAGAREAATANPVWTRPGTLGGLRGWTAPAWRGWSLAAVAGRPHSGDSPRRSSSSCHPGPL